MKHFLSISDYTKDQILKVLNLAKKLKTSDKSKYLEGKTLAMIFQKPSNRTRLSFEVGMFQLGGHAVNIRSEEIGMGEREIIADVARTISRYVDCVMIRANKHQDIEKFASFSDIPVINGLSDYLHPCQAMADILTISEHKDLNDIKICYIGDGNNVARSLLNISNILGINLTICTPKGYELKEYPSIINPQDAIKNADVVYTDVWTSMGYEKDYKKRIKDFQGYTVTKEIMSHAKSDAIFMHCLPAHREEEVTNNVLESSQSVVFDQAENRLHVQKAILVALLGGKK